MDWHLSTGTIVQFHTITDSELKERNGRQAMILRVINRPEPGYDMEALPMYEIEFDDGFITSAWSDELSTSQREH